MHLVERKLTLPFWSAFLIPGLDHVVLFLVFLVPADDQKLFVDAVADLWRSARVPDRKDEVWLVLTSRGNLLRNGDVPGDL